MLRTLCTGCLVLLAGFTGGAASAAPAPTTTTATAAMPPTLFTSLHWRFIGPYRGGRTDAVAGVPGKLAIAYIGTVDGGIFKTVNAGATWQLLFQHEPVASIGALAVADSNPNVIYAGTGENTIRTDATFGDGIYRSSDAGKTWQHVGLDDTRHIGRILVSPTDPNRVLVAALGHAWGTNSERGVFLTTDGGQHWQKTLYVNDRTGAIDLARDPAQPQSVYASTWSMNRPPWFQYAPLHFPGAAIYHSNDGGATWQKTAMHGLPADMGRVGLAVGDTAAGPRIYAIVSTGTPGGANSVASGSGLYRSDDGGAHWTLVNATPRLSGRGWYFARVAVDPKNPDIVYIPNTTLYRSTDGGVHFTALKGSPDGDDLQRLWIDPADPDHLVATADQGGSVSLDDGATWSSWFNQPSAQIYHLSTDDQVPFNVYATQQDSGALMIPSRGRSGIITNHDWRPVAGGGESGYIFPKRGDPNVIYGSSSGGMVSTYNLATEIATPIPPQPLAGFGSKPTAAGYSAPWNTALAPSPFDADTLFAGTRKVYATTDAGQHWRAISPVLTRYTPDAKCPAMPNRATAAECGYSVVYALGASPVERGVIWAGTDDGRLWVTRDGGGHWSNVTPPDIGNWGRIDTVAPDPHQAGTAYVAVDRHEVDDLAPYIFITHDFGEHWRKATDGIPASDYVRVVRADPDRAGLLYAGTEFGVFVSFDDGHAWQSLQLNLPPSSVRDLRVHAGDLIVGTHGRGIWILDDIAPLRQASAAIAQSAAHLYRPQPAVEFSLGIYPGEARPPEVAHAANPPTGAIIDYWLGKPVHGPVTLSIYDAAGKLVRQYSSADKPVAEPQADFPKYFRAPPVILTANAGANRFVWNFRGTPPAGKPHWAGPAVLCRTPLGPVGPWMPAGPYRVVLTVDGKQYSQPLTVQPNPYGWHPAMPHPGTC
ncbi:MAG TPA: hypothetical protein VF264_05985 [Rhodanobacteraceae bacterium]